jgi:hypothetical protein
VWRTQGGIRRRIEVPLFPSYGFVCVRENEDHYQLGNDYDVMQLLECHDQERLSAELISVEHVCRVNPELKLYTTLFEGARVRVASGSLMGTEGVIYRREGFDRFGVLCTMMDRTVEISIDGAVLEPL